MTEIKFHDCTCSDTNLKTFLSEQRGIETATLSLDINDHKLVLTHCELNAIGSGSSPFPISRWLESLFVRPVLLKSLTSSTLSRGTVDVDKLLSFLQISKSLQISTLEKVSLCGEMYQSTRASIKLTIKGATELHFRHCTTSATDLKTFLCQEKDIQTFSLDLNINNHKLIVKQTKFKAIGSGPLKFYISKWLDSFIRMSTRF